MAKMIKELPTDESFDVYHNDHLFMYQRADNDVTHKAALSSIINTIFQSHIGVTGDITKSITNGVLTLNVNGSDAQTWYLSDTQPQTAEEGDLWLHTDITHLGDIDEYKSDTWTFKVNMKGHDGIDGTNGTDGITPHIDPTSKHWMIGSTDTNIVAEGQNGTNGITPSINSTTKHWMIGEIDTGVNAEGQDGATGATGNDGYSVSATIDTITGGHRLTISSTNPSVSDVTADIMDGTEIIQTNSDNKAATLTAAGWQGSTAPYTQTVTVSGMTSSIVPIISCVVSATVNTGLEQMKQWKYISRATTDTNAITFYCYKIKPTVDLVANIKVV